MVKELHNDKLKKDWPHLTHLKPCVKNVFIVWHNSCTSSPCIEFSFKSLHYWIEEHLWRQTESFDTCWPSTRSLVLFFVFFQVCFLCFVYCHCTSKGRTKRAADILKIVVCFLTYPCVYVALQSVQNKAAVWMNRCTVQPSALAGRAALHYRAPPQTCQPDYGLWF